MANAGTPPPAKLSRMQRMGMSEKPKDLRGTLARLWRLTAGRRKGLGWVLLLSALASGSAILSPLLIGKAVGAIDAGDPALTLLVLLLALYVGDWLVQFLQKFFMAAIGQNMILQIRTRLFEAMKTLPLSFFDRRQHGELMSRLTNDVDNISATLTESATQLLLYGFTILGVFCSMVLLSPVLTGVALVTVALVFLLVRVITRRTRKLFSEQQAILGRLNAQIEESVSGLNLVKAFGRERDMVAQFEEKNGQFQKVATRALVWSGFLVPIMNVIRNLGFVGVAVTGGLLAVRGAVGVGDISSFLLYTRQFTRPFIEIANLYNTFLTAVAGAERVFEIMDEQPEPADRPDALTLDHPRGDVRFTDVSFSYVPGRPVLRHVDLHIPAGMRVAVVGPTGAGKTTFINLLTRFYDVDEGGITLDGHDLRDYRMRDLRSAFGVVLQDPALFDLSVRDNIAYGQDGVSEARIVAAAEAAGADAFIRRLPEGYDTVLHQGGAALSQGEKQLLTIARAVLRNAPILILDEATSSVDTVTEQRIQKAMLALSEGRTSIIIAHRLSTIRDADRIVVIEDGRITEQGTHEELVKKGGAYAAMYRTQTEPD